MAVVLSTVAPMLLVIRFLNSLAISRVTGLLVVLHLEVIFALGNRVSQGVVPNFISLVLSVKI